MIENLLIISFFYFLIRLIVKIGTSFPLFELTVVLYLLQYGIAPMLEYDFNPDHTMSLEKDEYLFFALSSCLAFAAGLFIVKNHFSIDISKIDPQLASVMGRVLLIIGIGSNIAMYILPESLRAVMNFFILFKMVGVFALIFSEKKLDKIIVGIVFVEIALSAILNALLIEFIVFSIFFAMFFGLKYTISNKVKILVITGSLLFLTVYQSVKAEYREIVWKNEVSLQAKVALLGNLITFESLKAAFNADISNNESVLQTIHRLNQGWQTSMVLDHVPTVVEFQNGQDFLNDVISSVLPRFLWPEKREVNDYQRFNYYTGYNLNTQTSMSVGVLGDFYLNFGLYGTFLAIFFFGIFLAKIFNWFYHSYVMENPLNLIWLPFIFSYLIRPGNEFYMVLNHLIKAFIVLFFIQRFVLHEIEKRATPVTTKIIP